jgi:hypothetical protein
LINIAPTGSSRTKENSTRGHSGERREARRMMPRVVPCEIAVDISEHLIDVRQLLTQVEVMTLCLRRSECIERKESPTEISRSVR